MMEKNRLTQGVLVQVCIACGKQYSFDRQEPPAGLTCDRCGNTVFRSFFEAVPGDDVTADFRAATERDVTTEDPATDVTRGDLRDLGSV